jgi:pimeloyl-ACP methyl ester carboxylesterase
MNSQNTPHFPLVGVSVVADSGSGRAYVAILDDARYLHLAQAACEKLGGKARFVLLACAPITNGSWESLSDDVTRELQLLNVRQASLIGFAAGATLAQNVALREPRFVRSLVVVDASARPHPTLCERVVDAIEARLPFGLPLRLGNTGFNVKAYLHRFRCPLLVVVTHRASLFVREELRALAQLAPTAWLVDFSGKQGVAEVEELSSTVEAFQDTPVRCPQKNLKGAA